VCRDPSQVTGKQSKHGSEPASSCFVAHFALVASGAAISVEIDLVGNIFSSNFRLLSGKFLASMQR
jgi:hypothetical protein